MDTHSFLLKLHLEREAFLRQAIAQIKRCVCQETNEKAKDELEEYKKELEQSLKWEGQELRELRRYEDGKT